MRTRQAPSRSGKYIYRVNLAPRVDNALFLNQPGFNLLVIDELGFVPLSRTGTELLFEVFSQRYERGSLMVATNLPLDGWTVVVGSERLIGALLDRLTQYVHFPEMNGESYRLKHSRENDAFQTPVPLRGRESCNSCGSTPSPQPSPEGRGNLLAKRESFRQYRTTRRPRRAAVGSP